MKLKEIKPGMVIHCNTEEEATMLWEELCRIGNMNTDDSLDSLENFKSNFKKHNYLIKNLNYETWACTLKLATHEFSDLIIPEEEMSAEEAIQ